MEKKRVSVQIEGRSYSLITTDDEKYVQKVANEVLSHIRKAAQSTKQLDTRDCAVLAALNFCDDRNKALKKNKDYVEKADKIIQQTNDLNRLCKEYREKLTEAMNDNTRLINNNKELEKRHQDGRTVMTIMRGLRCLWTASGIFSVPVSRKKCWIPAGSRVRRIGQF